MQYLFSQCVCVRVCMCVCVLERGLARLWRMSICLSPDGAKGLCRCMILQGVFLLQSAINARGHLRAPEAPPAAPQWSTWQGEARGARAHARVRAWMSGDGSL